MARRETGKELEGLVSLDVAVELIPFPSKNALNFFLSKNSALFPARYRTTHYPGVGNYEIRMLTRKEIEKIREMMIHYRDESKYANVQGRPPGPRRNTLADFVLGKLATA